MNADTTPVVTDPHMPTPEQLAEFNQYVAWRGKDPKRSGVMAKHGFTAGFQAGRHYEQEHQA